MEQRAIVEVFFDVAKNVAPGRVGDQSAKNALTNGRAEFESMQWGERDGAAAIATAMPEGCGSVVVGNVECDRV